MNRHSFLCDARQRPWTRWDSVICSGMGGTLLAVGLAAAWNNDQRQLQPVAGRILLDGRPPAGAVVRFHPAVPHRWFYVTPSGTVDHTGAYIVTTGRGQGIPAGEYRVTLLWRPTVVGDNGLEQSDNILPQRYASSLATPLNAVVVTGNNKLPTFEVDCCHEPLSLHSPR